MTLHLLSLYRFCKVSCFFFSADAWISALPRNGQCTFCQGSKNSIEILDWAIPSSRLHESISWNSPLSPSESAVVQLPPHRLALFKKNLHPLETKCVAQAVDWTFCSSSNFFFR